MSQQRIPRTPISVAHDHLGSAVHQLRAAHKISQEELGTRAGLHRNYVGAIERGEINPTYRILLKLGDGLGIRPSRLLAIAEHISAQWTAAEQEAARSDRLPLPDPAELIGSVHESTAP